MSNGFVVIELGESLEDVDVSDFNDDDFSDVIRQELADRHFKLLSKKEQKKLLDLVSQKSINYSGDLSQLDFLRKDQLGDDLDQKEMDSIAERESEYNDTRNVQKELKAVHGDVMV